MCGIAGLFTVERPARADLVAAVLRMLDAQVHRGPNDWGILLPEGAAQDREVRSLLEPRGWEHVRTYPGTAAAPAAILGTRRLSILDVSTAGRMPMGSPDGRVWGTYNGEIYNFRELRAELIAAGHRFRSQGDSETLIHAYQEWGPGVVDRLRGMFAFAALDVRAAGAPKLFLARDRFGIKPLYWGRHRCVFQFASEVRALMAGGLTPYEPEPRGFHGFLVHGSVPTPWTTVRDVLSLPAAHTLTVDEVSYSYPKAHRYWSLPPAGSRLMPHAEAVAETRRLLDESVRMHLVSDVPLGVFLSGGMDSSALVALASRHLPHPLTTLCVTFDEAEFSEGERAAGFGRRYGTKHVEVRLRARDFVAELPPVLAAMDQPTIDGVNTYFVAKAAREAGLTVALSGVGGDELFRGYPGFRRAPRLGRLSAIPGGRLAAATVGALARRLGFPRLEKLEFLREHPALGPYLAVRGLFPPARAARLLGAGPLPLPTRDVGEEPLTPDHYARLEVSYYLQNQLLRDTDVFGMAHGLEIRVPFLDHRLAELVFGLPAAYLQAPGAVKPLLAEAMGDDLPEGITRHPKKGFGFPFDQWMKEAWPAIAIQAEHAGPIVSGAAKDVTADFRVGRVHWSRPWAIAVLRGMRGRGAIPSWGGDGGPRRVLALLPEVYSSTGGIPTYCKGLLRAMSEAFPRSDVRVVSLNDDGMPLDASMVGRVHFSGAGPRCRGFRRLSFVWAALGAAARLRPDLIVVGHIHIAPLGLVLRCLTGARTGLLTYGIEAWNPPKHLRWAARRMDRVLAISRFTKGQAVLWGAPESRVSLLPNMVDGEVFRPLRRRRDKSGPRILTVSRLARSERYKGVDRVLETMPEILARVPGLRYVVIGQGDDLPRLQRLAGDLGIASCVEFRGFVPDHELPLAYSEADLFVMASTGEGFGFVFVEALACGTPVVAGNRDGSVDALLGGELGRLEDPEVSGGLVEAIVSGLGAHGSAMTGESRVLRDKVLAAYGFDEFRAGVRMLFRDAGSFTGPPNEISGERDRVGTT